MSRHTIIVQRLDSEQVMGIEMTQDQVAAFAVVYGASGLGKSTDMAATFPNALFVCRPGGMQCAGSFLGAPVREVHVRTLEDVINLIPLAKEHGHDAIVVDDLSLLAESTERDFDRQWPGRPKQVREV